MIEDIRTFLSADLLDGQPVADEDDLLLSGMVDSLGVMRLVAFLEGRFQIEVPPADVTIENFENLRAITSYVGTRVAA